MMSIHFLSMATSRKTKPHRKSIHARVRRGNLEDADRTRRELLAAAARLFAERGLEGVTIRAVAALAEVSAMTPYRYFPNKAELLAGLWESVIADVYTAMKAAVNSAVGARARQRASLETFLAYWENNPDHYRLVYMTEQTTRAGLRGEGRPVLADSPIYHDILGLVLEVTRDLALEIGADMTHAKLAGDVRFMMLLGYLNSQLVNRRYPWSDVQVLRAAYIEQIVVTVERCLRFGPATADADSRPAHRPRERRLAN
jgi:AcrR family transcriptional regulator